VGAEGRLRPGVARVEAAQEALGGSSQEEEEW
jgi:hypothetical protein